jgi:DNA repair protein RecO (recombination protein O)
MHERIYKTQAIVLRRYDFGEAGKQLIVYTPRQGKLSLIAKGVKRSTSKMAGHLEPLTLSHVVAARGRNLDTITQAATVEAFATLRTEPDRLFHGLVVTELLDRLTQEHEQNAALWDLFVETLRRLDTDADPWVAATYFHVRLLAIAGYKPQLDGCVECGGALRAEAVYYSPRLGGTLCPDCRASHPSAWQVSANSIKALRAASGGYGVFRRVRTGPSLRQELDALLRANLRGLLDIEIGASALLDSMR